MCDYIVFNPFFNNFFNKTDKNKMLNRTVILSLVFFFFFCFIPSGENEWKFDGNVGHFTDLFSFSCTNIPLLITVVSDRINGSRIN